MFEDMARIEIPRTIVIHPNGSTIDLIIVINPLEMVRPVTGCFVACPVTRTWSMIP